MRVSLFGCLASNLSQKIFRNFVNCSKQGSCPVVKYCTSMHGMSIRARFFDDRSRRTLEGGHRCKEKIATGTKRVDYRAVVTRLVSIRGAYYSDKEERSFARKITDTDFMTIQHERRRESLCPFSSFSFRWLGRSDDRSKRILRS